MQRAGGKTNLEKMFNQQEIDDYYHEREKDRKEKDKLENTIN